MIKLPFTLILFILISFSTLATHNKGGYIYYSAISSSTYEITVVTYTTIQSYSADRCELLVHFGDGTSKMVERINGSSCSSPNPDCDHCGEVEGDVKINKYRTQHTYTQNGNFTISMTDPNRNGGIINVPNSINVEMFLETNIAIDLSNTNLNNSIQLMDVPTKKVPYGEVSLINISAYDPDGDIVAYSLTTPIGTGGVPIPGYTLPSGVIINKVTGEMSLPSNLSTGVYTFAIKVEECNGGAFWVSSIIDFNIEIIPSIYSSQFSVDSIWIKDYFDRYTLTISETDSLDFGFTLNHNFLSNNLYDVKLESELIQKGANFTVQKNTVNATGRVNWTPTSADVRCAPYIITINQVGRFNEDLTLMLFVRNSTITANCELGCGEILSDNTINTNSDIQIFPNPVGQSETLTLRGKNLKGAELSLYNVQGSKIGSYRFNNRSELQIETTHLPSGIYFYSVLAPKSRKVGKFLIK